MRNELPPPAGRARPSPAVAACSEQPPADRARSLRDVSRASGVVVRWRGTAAVHREANFGASCAAAGWPAGSPGFAAKDAGWTGSCRSPAKDALCVPSCGGRRMAERAAHLVDQLFPDVPVRQWVLTLLDRLRYLLAWDHRLCRAVVGIFMRAVLGALQRQARAQGMADGRSGAVG